MRSEPRITARKRIIFFIRLHVLRVKQSVYLYVAVAKHFACQEPSEWNPFGFVDDAKLRGFDAPHKVLSPNWTRKIPKPCRFFPLFS